MAAVVVLSSKARHRFSVRDKIRWLSGGEFNRCCLYPRRRHPVTCPECRPVRTVASRSTRIRRAHSPRPLRMAVGHRPQPAPRSDAQRPDLLDTPTTRNGTAPRALDRTDTATARRPQDDCPAATHTDTIRTGPRL